MTAALEGGEWSAARPGCTLPLGKTQYPFYRRLGGPQGQSGLAENVVPAGIRSRTVQPIVSRYTNWATGPTCIKYLKLILVIFALIYLTIKFPEFSFESTALKINHKRTFTELIKYSQHEQLFKRCSVMWFRMWSWPRQHPSSSQV